jgi:hypothetical protein
MLAKLAYINEAVSNRRFSELTAPQRCARRVSLVRLQPFPLCRTVDLPNCARICTSLGGFVSPQITGSNPVIGSILEPRLQRALATRHRSSKSAHHCRPVCIGLVRRTLHPKRSSECSNEQRTYAIDGSKSRVSKNRSVIGKPRPASKRDLTPQANRLPQMRPAR